MCSPSAPTPPDPVATAQAQVGINRDAIGTAAKFNQVNQVSPYGTSEWSGNAGQYLDPDAIAALKAQGKTDSEIQAMQQGNLTQTTTLSPELQQLLTGQLGISQGLTDLSNQRLAGIPQDPFQAAADPNGYIGIQQLDPRANQPLQRSIGSAGNIQGGVNQDFSGQLQSSRDAAYDSQAQYLDPRFAREQQGLESQLAAQGIPQGSEAWNNAMDQFGETKNQAYQGAQDSATLAGNQLQNQLFGQSLQGGQFANSAQQQNYDQLMGNADLYNQSGGQQFQQGMDIMNYNMNAALAGGNYNQQEYQRQLANQIQGRNQNFNELAAFLNGSPIAPSNPTFQTTPTYNAAQASPDAVGMAASNYSAQSQARANILGSIFGSLGKVGAAAVKPCWVAREVYGTETNRWMMFRHYLMTKAPTWFQSLYIAHGECVARWLADKPRLKTLVRSWMDGRIAAYA